MYIRRCILSLGFLMRLPEPEGGGELGKGVGEGGGKRGWGLFICAKVAEKERERENNIKPVCGTGGNFVEMELYSCCRIEGHF